VRNAAGSFFFATFFFAKKKKVGEPPKMCSAIKEAQLPKKCFTNGSQAFKESSNPCENTYLYH